MRDQFIDQLRRRAMQNPRIMLITGDLGFGVFDQYREDCPDQFINAGVAEQNMTAVAVGMAREGWIVFTYSIANFSTLRCLEQIRNDACYHKANVKIVSVGGGFSYGALGISHHATEDLAIMRTLPDINVVSPCSLWETRKATDAIIDTPGTCYLRLDKSSGADAVCSDDEQFEIGRARLLKEGNDITIFVTGGILGEVWKVVDILEDEGISVRIVSLHTIKPIDTNAIIASVHKTPILVSVEEHTVIGGLGGAISEVLFDHHVCPRSFLRIGLTSGFSSVVGSQEYLRYEYKLDSKSIADKIRNSL